MPTCSDLPTVMLARPGYLAAGWPQRAAVWRRRADGSAPGRSFLLSPFTFPALPCRAWRIDRRFPVLAGNRGDQSARVVMVRGGEELRRLAGLDHAATV